MALASDFPLDMNPTVVVPNIAQIPLGLGGIVSPDWDALNATVGGRLYRGEPYAKACFTSYNGQPNERDETACAKIQKEYFNSHMPRSNTFGGFSAIQWDMCPSTGDNCHLDWRVPTNRAAYERDCKQGSVAPFYIDVKNQYDVIAAYDFHKKTNITLSIKNTGHDFKGRSSAPDSLSLWMHNLKFINHDGSFVADGCKVEGQSALTMGAGTQFEDIRQFTDAHNLQFVVGSDQSVGAVGGWVQGGGHSTLSPAYGMGADRVLQYKIVTPDGVYRTANACQNEDLFWALRGGGGGTFGVVLEATMMVSPQEPFMMANINWPTGNNDNLKLVVEMFLNNITSFAKSGWGGNLTPSLGNLLLTVPSRLVNEKEAVEAMQAFIDLTTKLGGTSTVSTIPTFNTWFNGWIEGTLGEQDPNGLPIVCGSRLVPAKNHETAEGRAELLEAIMTAFGHSAFSQIHITTPYAFKGDSGETSYNPVWKQSLYQLMIVNSWLWDSGLPIREYAFSQSVKAIKHLREITPEGAAYVNESDIREPNWQETFWGKNYPRLLAIKQKYDPDHILDCWHCVGWKGANDPRYKCYI